MVFFLQNLANWAKVEKKIGKQIVWLRTILVNKMIID